MVSKTCRGERSFPRKHFSSRLSGAGPLAAVFSKVGDCHTAGLSLLSLWRCKTERCVKIFPLDAGHSQYIDLLYDLPNFQFPISFLSSFLIIFAIFIQTLLAVLRVGPVTMQLSRKGKRYSFCYSDASSSQPSCHRNKLEKLSVSHSSSQVQFLQRMWFFLMQYLSYSFTVVCF